MFAQKDFHVMKDAYRYRLLAFPIPSNFRRTLRALSRRLIEDLMRAPQISVPEVFQKA
jgi:hypothetical protein